jgi:gliding motility-associated-like protein
MLVSNYLISNRKAVCLLTYFEFLNRICIVLKYLQLKKSRCFVFKNKTIGPVIFFKPKLRTRQPVLPFSAEKQIHRLKPHLAIALLFLILSPLISAGQKEASVWPIGDGKQLNFQSGNIEYINFEHWRAIASICDNDGNLVLSFDGDTVKNKNNKALINGTRLAEKGYVVPQFSCPVFVPCPEKEGIYFLIYNCIQFEYKNGKSTIISRILAYAEIDINANGGQGEVTRKQQEILTDCFNNPTIAGFCNNSYYWMAIDYHVPYTEYDGTLKSVLLFYKIDKNGISTEPIANRDFEFGQFINLRFSPSGDKLFFLHFPENSTPFTERGVLADFNFLTGELYNYRLLEYNMFTGVEFSPDSRFVYFVNFGYNNRGPELVQYDARYLDNIGTTRKVIVEVPENSDFELLNLLRLATDGKIYFPYVDLSNDQTKLARINEPNMPGTNSVEFNVATINQYPLFPEFVTSFFRDKSLDEIDNQGADAGPDQQLCPQSALKIGNENSYPAGLYQWFPRDFLDNQFTPAPVFKAPLQGNITKHFTKTLRVTNLNCWLQFDSVQVTVLPKPNKASIVGSYSICPFVNEVDYWIHENNVNNEWFANGGQVVTDNTRDTVKISWGGINPNAAVKVLSTNQFGCVSDTSYFPVQIDTKLFTNAAKGPEYLCMAEANAADYWIIGTNGSVYDWIVEGGEVISGQGTNKVTVNWKEDGFNKIYIKENSVTSQAVCYGESEQLEVEILNDSLEIELAYVTFNLQNNLEMHYKSDDLDLHLHKLDQQTENTNSGIISEFHPLNTGLKGYFIYRSTPGVSGSEIINLKVTNRCNETFYSNKQQSVVLHGEALNEKQTISLHWNVNQFWEKDHLSHEIWYYKKNDDIWQLVATLDNETSYDYEYQNTSLYHSFRIKEINTDKNLESWSNIVELKLTDNLKIPSVFTPNNDGYNDFWEIWNIESFPFRSLTIFDKTGKPVFQCKNWFIPWDGKINGEVYQGTYFYTLTFEGNTINGQLTVLQ